ncbi:MAG: hypothetical protein U0R69_08250 [Gaiellales bacterium]
MVVSLYRVPEVVPEHDCAACGESTDAPESLLLAGEPTRLVLHLVLCPDCRADEPELGGQG